MGSPNSPVKHAHGAIVDDAYEALVRLSPDALYVLQDERVVFVNAACVRLMHASAASELIGLPVSVFIHADSLDQARSRIAAMLATGYTAPPMEQKYVRRDGKIVEVEDCSAPFLYEGQPAIQVMARDITDRKVAEARLRQIDESNQELTAEVSMTRARLFHEKKILEMIALDRPLGDIMREACVAGERVLQGNARCSVLLLEPDGVHLRVGAAPSLPESVQRALSAITVGPGTGSCGKAIHSNRQIVVADIEHDPLWVDCVDLALTNDMRAGWSTPIASSSGAMLGAFGVYYSAARSPGQEDMALVRDLTYLLGIAIHKDQVERTLQESEEHYRSVVNCLTEGIIVQSREGAVITCNPSAERILRLPPNTLVGGMKRGSYFKRIIAENGAEIPRNEWPTQIVLRTGEPQYDLIVGLEHIDGQLTWISESVLPIRKSGESQPSAVLISFTDISEVKAAQQRLQFLASHDALTGLPNRSLLTDRLSQLMAEVRENGHWVATLFLDLDRFKSVNDTVGHAAGDRILQTVAGRLASCIRTSDTLAHLGGDEFVVLAEGFGDTRYLTGLCDRILQSIAEPFRVDGHESYLGVSIGVGLYPQDGEDGAALLRCAHTAMYFAKEAGRNNAQFYTSEMNASTQRRYLLEKHLRRALARHEFRLHYQPMVDLLTGAIVGAEALLRWENPDTGMVSPIDFIPIAEEIGLIVPIGQWVMEEACKQMATWRKTLRPDLRIAVNLSSRQFQDDSLVATVNDILQRTGLPGQALELEITESLLMGDDKKLMPVFDALSGNGIRFSLDDFGTGYSSLSYLQSFPIDNLKIDRSFIENLLVNNDSAALTKAIIAMAKSLKMSVTAEGVEEERQMEFLKAAGCQEMQGFYFSEAVTVEKFEELFR